MKKVDLNCDFAESFGAYTIGCDEKILPMISSVNIACGWHGGDPVIMRKAVAKAKENNVAVGAHPGFPDLMGFGRRPMKISPEEAQAYVQYQTGALLAFCLEAKIELQHVKPHGALYNMAAKDPTLARAVCRAVKGVSEDLILLALSGSEMAKAAEEENLPFRQEVFADRGYLPDGTLVPRGSEGAIITDEELAVKRVIRMITEGKVTANNGEDIVIKADSVCLHGDNEKAVLFAEKISAALSEAGIAVTPLGRM